MISNMDKLKRQTVFRDDHFSKKCFCCFNFFFVHANRIFVFEGHIAISCNAREIFNVSGKYLLLTSFSFISYNLVQLKQNALKSTRWTYREDTVMKKAVLAFSGLKTITTYSNKHLCSLFLSLHCLASHWFRITQCKTIFSWEFCICIASL